jgi:hypothetical protein
LAEETAVFAVELNGALVSDLKGRSGDVDPVDEHTRPRSLQSELFLILKRTQGGEHLKMKVQRGDAYSSDFGESSHP